MAKLWTQLQYTSMCLWKSNFMLPCKIGLIIFTSQDCWEFSELCLWYALYIVSTQLILITDPFFLSKSNEYVSPQGTLLIARELMSPCWAILDFYRKSEYLLRWKGTFWLQIDHFLEQRAVCNSKKRTFKNVWGAITNGANWSRF